MKRTILIHLFIALQALVVLSVGASIANCLLTAYVGLTGEFKVMGLANLVMAVVGVLSISHINGIVEKAFKRWLKVTP